MSDEYNEFEEEEFTSQLNRGTVWRIARLGINHWPYMLGFLLCISMVSLIESWHTYLSKQMIDLGIVAQDMDALRYYGSIYLASWPIFALFVFGFILCAGWLGHMVQYDLRRTMFNHLQELPLSYYDKTPTGWLMSRVTSDVTRVGDLVSWGFLDITWTITSVTTSLVFMFIINWQMTLIVIALIPVLYKVAIEFKKRILVEYRIVRKVNSKITGAFSENISGVRVVKSLRREEKNLSQFQELTGDMYESGYKAAWLSALFLPAVQIVSAVGVALVVWYSGGQFSAGSMSAGSIHAFVAYITFMLWPIQQLAAVYASMQQAIASGERIFSLVDTEADIVDADDAIDPGTIRGDITFDHLSFQYEKDKPVLVDFNLTIPQGETVALVGPTGAGKSTIVNLLCRFYEPTQGTIRFNGRDYRTLTQHAIHSRIGMVLQTPH
ncbi:MAG: ATP-binding cassette domain-containing protein, partial [Chloroflexi bacterium]|nr:ATP-binding cassette domain-containing protein [Chloroflexota bacterium]